MLVLENEINNPFRDRNLHHNHAFQDLCRVYTCRFDNQVTNEKLIKKYFLVVKLTQYFVCDVNRQLASYCKQEI